MALFYPPLHNVIYFNMIKPSTAPTAPSPKACTTKNIRYTFKSITSLSSLVDELIFNSQKLHVALLDSHGGSVKHHTSSYPLVISPLQLSL